MNALRELHEQHENFAGTSGLLYFSDHSVFSYTRDANTHSFPFYVDLAGGAVEGNETPFQTWRRECQEETGLDTTPEQIIYAKQYPSLVDASRIGYFVVAAFSEEAKHDIAFGDEGLSYQITSIEDLLAEPLIIPYRKMQVETFLAETAMLRAYVGLSSVDRQIAIPPTTTTITTRASEDTAFIRDFL